MSGAKPLLDAFVFEQGSLPCTLPTTLAELDSSRRSTGIPPSKAPLTLFLTIDTEDAYFTRPHLMTGEGIGREFGVFGILDALEQARMHGTFFVNVYETTRQPAGAVEAVVKEISARGHEVGLHAHPSPALDFYPKALFRLPLSAQIDALRWGAELLERWTGERTTSFRAGGYALNDETFMALREVGIAIDSSCFFPSRNNHFERFSVNSVAAHHGVVEVPVTTVLRVRPGGALEHRKLDLDWLSRAHLSNALDSIASLGGGFAMFMMHSFSFIEKATRPPSEPQSKRALFTSETLFGHYVEVYGPKPEMRSAFVGFLEDIRSNPALRILTLRDALSDLPQAAVGSQADIVPIVGSNQFV